MDSADKIKKLEARVAKAEAAKAEYEQVKANMIANNGYGSTSTTNENSDERRAMRYFGCGHIKDLLQVNTAHPNYKHVPAELKHLVRDLKKDFDTSRMIQHVLNGEPLDRGPNADRDNFSHVKGVLDGSYFAKHVLAPKLKAFGSTVGG